MHGSSTTRLQATVRGRIPITATPVTYPNKPYNAKAKAVFGISLNQVTKEGTLSYLYSWGPSFLIISLVYYNTDQYHSILSVFPA